MIHISHVLYVLMFRAASKAESGRPSAPSPAAAVVVVPPVTLQPDQKTGDVEVAGSVE